MSLILPESNEVLAWKAEQAQQVESKVREMEHWETELKRIDMSLSLVVAKPGSEDEGLMPGYWHLRKEIPNAPDEYWPLVGPNDERREPGGWLFDVLRAEDLWNPRVHRAKREAKEKLREAKVRAKRLEAEQRADHIAADVSAIKRLRSEKGLKTISQPKREGRGLRSPGSVSEEP